MKERLAKRQASVETRDPRAVAAEATWALSLGTDAVEDYATQ